MDKKITKRKKVTLVLKPELDEWKTLPDSQALDVMRAHGHPVRRIILTLLDIRPMRKSEIARYIHRFLGKKYSRSLVQHHLKQLERAGLVGYMDDPEVPSKTKLAYLAARIRVQVKLEPKPGPVEMITSELVEMEFWSRYKKQREKEQRRLAAS